MIKMANKTKTIKNNEITAILFLLNLLTASPKKDVEGRINVCSAFSLSVATLKIDSRS